MPQSTLLLGDAMKADGLCMCAKGDSCATGEKPQYMSLGAHIHVAPLLWRQKIILPKVNKLFSRRESKVPKFYLFGI